MQCWNCQTQFPEGAFCPRCGSAQNAASPQTLPQTPPQPTRKPPTKLFVLIGALALALIAGVAIAGPLVSNTLTGKNPGGGPAKLNVTGTPPSITGSWASGVKEVWRQPTTTFPPIGTGLQAGYLVETPLRFGSVWRIRSGEGETYTDYDISPATGKTIRSGTGLCADKALGTNIPCVRYGASGAQPALELRDLETGKLVSSTPFASLGITAEYPYVFFDIIQDHIIITSPDYPNDEGEGSRGDIGSVRVYKVPASGGKALWSYKYTVKNVGACDYEALSQVQLHHGILASNLIGALDFETGKPVIGSAGCAGFLTPDVLYSASTEGKKSLTAPDGTAIKLSDTWHSATVKKSLPTVPLRLTQFSQPRVLPDPRTPGTARLEAFDPETRGSRWATPLTVDIVGSAQPGGLTIAQTHGVLLVSDTATLRAVQPETGAVLWTRSVPKEYAELLNPIDVTQDGTVISNITVNHEARSQAIDIKTGASLWSAKGSIHLATDGDGAESLLQFHNSYSQGTYTGFIARLAPADRVEKPQQAPSDAPACPAGMNPISWTKYSDGSVLLCQDNTHIEVVHAHKWSAKELIFDGFDYTVTFTNGVSVRVCLGGTFVVIEKDGKTTYATGTTSWNNVTGPNQYTVKQDGLASCPAGSWPISYSRFNSGWLLVCGTTHAQPKTLHYAEGANTLTAENVNISNNGYCGTSGAQTVCAYHSPALVTLTDSAGKQIQHSVSENSFAGTGTGGTGKGTGAYGVAVPKADSKDQIRYLTEILQKSMIGRSNIETAVDQIRSCSDLGSATNTVRLVITNREELLTALASTPVDTVPEGPELVAKLKLALSSSLESDHLWLKWALSESATGCAARETSPHYQQVQQNNIKVSEAKSAFTSTWNTSIAPKYGAPTFSVKEI